MAGVDETLAAEDQETDARVAWLRLADRKEKAGSTSADEGLIRPACGAMAAVARETHRCFRRRLPRGYSRFGDARPGRHQIVSGRCTGEDSRS